MSKTTLSNSTLTENLIQLCNLNTHSFNVEGLAKCQTLLENHFKALDPTTTVIKTEPLITMNQDGSKKSIPLGNILSFKKHETAPFTILFSIHYDTVFEPSSPFQTVKQVDDETLEGPGVADAKSGILIILETLRWLEQSPLKGKIGWHVVLNPDEESGSTGSKDYLMDAAKEADLGLVFEPSMPDGTMIHTRKGSCVFNIACRGTSAHVGRHFKDGDNAILKLSSLLQKLNALPLPEDSIFNIGLISGGQAVNIVPDIATCQCNLRTDTLDVHEAAFSQIQATLDQHPDTELFIETHRPPKPLTDKESEYIKKLESVSKTPLNWQASGGVSDANYLAHVGLPTIDTLGPLGGNLHTTKEYVNVPSIQTRIELLKAFIQQII